MDNPWQSMHNLATWHVRSADRLPAPHSNTRSLHAQLVRSSGATRTVVMHSIGGHRHGVDAIGLQIITVARWATLARRLQSRLTYELRNV